MAKLKIYNAEGKNVGEKELSDSVFGVKTSTSALHEVVVGIMANLRRPFAHTKDRSDVRGGGKKPWRQKGTGRARHGSIRSPLWSGGGVTFGPRNERNYDVKINRKKRRQAFCAVLSDKVANEKLILVENLTTENGKTKEVASMIEKLPISGKTTFVTAAKDDMLSRSARNLQKVRTVTVNDMGLMDAVNTDFVVMTPEAADKLTERCGVNA